MSRGEKGYKVSVWCFFGGAKEVRGGAPAAMRPRRRGTFPDERLPQQVRRLAGVFLDQLSAGRWRATSPESASFANQQMVSLRIAGAGRLAGAGSDMVDIHIPAAVRRPSTVSIYYNDYFEALGGSYNYTVVFRTQPANCARK